MECIVLKKNDNLLYIAYWLLNFVTVFTLFLNFWEGCRSHIFAKLNSRGVWWELIGQSTFTLHVTWETCISLFLDNFGWSIWIIYSFTLRFLLSTQNEFKEFFITFMTLVYVLRWKSALLSWLNLTIWTALCSWTEFSDRPS